MRFVPQKSKDGDWVELRKLGKWGENWIDEYLTSKDIKIMPLNLYTMSDNSKKPMLWEDLKKYPKIPDFIAKNGNKIFLFDVKTKRKYDQAAYYFWINKRDYLHYLKFIDIVPVHIFFVFVNHKPVDQLTGKDIKGVFEHIVETRSYPEEYNIKDKNKVFNVKDFKNQIR